VAHQHALIFHVRRWLAIRHRPLLHRLPGRRARGKRPVVELAVRSTQRGPRLLLRTTGIEAVRAGFAQGDSGPLLLARDVARDRLLTDLTGRADLVRGAPQTRQPGPQVRDLLAHHPRRVARALLRQVFRWCGASVGASVGGAVTNSCT